VIEGTIGDFFDVKGGKRLPKGSSFSDKETSYPYLRVTDFQRNGFNCKDVKYIDAKTQSSIKRYTIASGVVYISIAGTIGVAGIIPDLFDGANLTENAAKLIPKKGVKIHNKFLSYFLNTAEVQNVIKSKTMAVGVPKLALFRIQEIPIKFPPPPEQQKIASILDAADNLRQKDQQLIKKYNALSQSLFLDMFGDPVTNPMGWDKRNLQDLVKSVIDCPHTTPNWTSSGKVAIRTSNLTQGGWSWKDKRFVSEEDFHDRSKRGYVKHGDIILSREGTVGVLAIVEMEMEICLGQRLVQLIPDFSLANNYYLLHLLLYELEPERISRIMVGATSKHLNVKELREMSLPVPPIDLQNQFAERIQVIETQKQLALASLEKSEALFNTLLQRAFKGELTT